MYYAEYETMSLRQPYRRMVSSGMLRRVAPVRATRRNIPKDDILHSHGHENLKSYNHTEF
jgi:hypothetical protein